MARFYRRRNVRPRRYTRRVARRPVYRKPMRMYRKISNRSLVVRKEMLGSVITGSATAQNLVYAPALYSPSGWNFDLGNLVAEYDMIKVHKFIFTLEPYQNESSVAPIEYMRVVHDYNDVTALTAESDYLAYGNCKSYALTRNRPIRIVLYPKISQFAISGTSATAATFLKSVKPGWLNTTGVGTSGLGLMQFMGVKLFVPAYASMASPLFNVRITLVASLKNNK